MKRSLLAACLLFSCLSCSRPGPFASSESALRKALEAGSGVVRLPAGAIEIGSELAVPEGVRDLEIRGEGRATVLRLANHFRGRALLVARNGARLRFRNFAVDGNRGALETRSGLPPSDIPFAKFTTANGILVDGGTGIEISGVAFSEVAGFAVLVHAAREVRIDGVTIENSGSRNAKGRNNTTGGILLEAGTSDFEVLNCDLRGIRGNGIWTHSLYTSPRNARGRIAGNRFHTIGRDAIQVGHATAVTVDGNSGSYIGFPPTEVDVEGRAFPVAIDTSGNVDASVYVHNRFEEINGKCIDLDGFHHGEVRENTCVNRLPPEAFPHGNYGIVMNNTNPDMRPEGVVISGNRIEGPHFGGVFVIGSGNRVEGNKLLNLNRAHCNDEAARFGCYYAAGEPDMLRSGIYLGRGAERPAPARDNVISGNEITGFGMKERCVGAAPGVSLADNGVSGNRCQTSIH